MGESAFLIGDGSGRVTLPLRYANRHGLVAGATGTGKTVTLQVLAEGFSRAGVPVVCADIKGDLSGIGCAGTPNPRIERRVQELKIDGFAYEAAPAIFWDLEGKRGHPMRATVAEMGPLLLARMLELNEAQAGVLAVAFELADDEGLLLLDLKDLVALLQEVAARASELSAYGHVSKATVGTIQRRLLALEQEGGAALFGEPALQLADLMLTTPAGRGAVNVLVADRLILTPRLYATFLLWLLSELFEQLPEVGDLDRPKLALFLDEAHLLFKDTPGSLVDKIEQVVRLIRSKGVGVYFVTQSPTDLPPSVLGQLGNRVQHALRAFTPIERKAVRTAAQTFRPNPKLDTERVVTELGVGEALVSTLEEKGVPGVVQQVKVAPPRSRIGPLTDEERAAVVRMSPLAGKYEAALDRPSAYEMLSREAGRAGVEAAPAGGAAQPRADGRSLGRRTAPPAGRGSHPGTAGRPSPRRRQAEPAPEPGMLESLVLGSGRREGAAAALTKSLVRSVGTQVGGQLGRAVVRGILGSILKR